MCDNKFRVFSDEAPTLFILIISSHGSADGHIQTDRKIPIESEPGMQRYETFTTKIVFEALKTNAWLKDAPKLVFFGVRY